MTTIIMESKSKAAQIMVEFLKTQSYVKVIDDMEHIPNRTTIKAIEEARSGKVIKAQNVKELLEKLK